jgi:hypothetical protein
MRLEQVVTLQAPNPNPWLGDRSPAEWEVISNACHVLEPPYTGFGLVIRFSAQLQFVITINCNSSRIYTVYSWLWHALSLFSQLFLHQCPLVTDSTAYIPFSWDLWTIPVLQPQQFSANSSTITLRHSRRRALNWNEFKVNSKPSPFHTFSIWNLSARALQKAPFTVNLLF